MLEGNCIRLSLSGAAGWASLRSGVIFVKNPGSSPWTQVPRTAHRFGCGEGVVGPFQGPSTIPRPLGGDIYLVRWGEHSVRAAARICCLHLCF